MSETIADRSSERLPRWLALSVVALSVALWAPELLGLVAKEELGGSVFPHALVEWSAVCASLFTALLGCLYFSVRADVLVATIALAALASGFGDALHALASLEILAPAAEPARFVPLTWASSRLLEASVLTAGALYLLRFGPRPPSRRGLCILALVVAALAFGTFGYLLSRPVLPQASFPDRVVTRPYDLAPLALFAFGGLVLFPRLRARHPGMLADVLLLSALVNALAQLHMSLGATTLHDPRVVLAHTTQLIAGFVPLAGISLYFAGAFQREARTAAEMERLVTDLRVTESRMRISQTRFDQLTQNIREVFWISSADAREHDYVSPAYEEIFGQPVQKLHDDPSAFLALVHPDDREKMAKRTVDPPLDGLGVEYRIIRPDGELRWLRTRGFPVRDEEGAIYRVAGITEDVTDDKLAEDALRRSEARIRALFQAVPDLVLRLNRSGMILDYHASGHVETGLSPSLFRQKSVSELLPPLATRIDEILDRTLESGRMESVEIRLDRASGPVDIEARIVRSTEDEVLVLVRNITEQKRLESEVLDISHREQLRMGHDLHDGLLQQLTGIALLSRVLQQQLETRGLPQHERAQQIRSLIEDAIVQTRNLARGLAPVELEDGNISAALEQLALAVERFRGVRCLCRCDEVSVDGPTEVTHLYRIAQEAISNALRHAAPSRIEVELTRDHDAIRLSVRDDGLGFDEALDMSSSGMGLRIMRYRARRIGATLTVKKAPGRGTEVSCEWVVPGERRTAVHPSRASQRR